MKKLWIILLVIVLVVSIGLNVVAITNRFVVKQVDKYEGVNNWNDSKLYVIKDKTTGVCYLIFEGYRKGGITVMYDSDGKILVEK